MRLERLLHLLERLQQAQVVGEFIGALGKAGEHREKICVDLARIRLAGDGDAGGKAHLPGDELLETAHLLLVAREQLHEARLRAGGALAAEQAQPPKLELKVFNVLRQLVHPERCALADGRELRGLEVGIGKARQRLVLFGERREVAQHLRRLAQHELRRFTQDNDVRVVADVAARRAEVDDRLGLGALPAEGVDVCHHVVAHLALARFGCGVVDVVLVRFHLGDLLVRDVEPQRLLGARQRDPEPSPRAELEVFGEDMLHLGACVARGEGGDVAVLVIRHGAHLPERSC